MSRICQELLEEQQKSWTNMQNNPVAVHAVGGSLQHRIPPMKGEADATFTPKEKL